MNVEQLQARERQLIRAARAKISEITDSTPESRARDIEREYDALMLELDEVRADIDGDQIDTSRRPSDEPRARGERWFDAASGQEVRVVRHDESFATQRSTGGLSLGGMVRAMIAGPRNDDEKRALSEGTSSAGGYLVPTPLSRQFIDAMRAQSRVVQSGATTVQMQTETLKMAKLSADPTPSWRDEAASVGTGDSSFSNVVFTARSLAMLTLVSRELLMDAANADQVIHHSLAMAFAGELDRVAMFGSGTAPEPQGLADITNINSVDMGTNGAAITDYSNILSALQKLEEANAPQPTGMIMAPRTKFTLAGLLTTTNEPMSAPAVVQAVPIRSTSRVPINETHGTAVDASRVLLGDWSQLMIGMREQISIRPLTERYADTGQIGLLCHARLDIQVQHAEAFCQIVGIIP